MLSSLAAAAPRLAPATNISHGAGFVQPVCESKCRGRQCTDILAIGLVSCSELNRLGCPCEGCCESAPPPPMPPMPAACGNSCKGHTCLEWLGFGLFTCTELRALL